MRTIMNSQDQSTSSIQFDSWETLLFLSTTYTNLKDFKAHFPRNHDVFLKFTINGCFSQSLFNLIVCQAVNDDSNVSIQALSTGLNLTSIFFTASTLFQPYLLFFVFYFLLFSANSKVENEIIMLNDRPSINLLFPQRFALH